MNLSLNKFFDFSWEKKWKKYHRELYKSLNYVWLLKIAYESQFSFLIHFQLVFLIILKGASKNQTTKTKDERFQLLALFSYATSREKNQICFQLLTFS